MKILKNSWWFLGFSTTLFAISILAMGIHYATTGTILRYGIDFTGGTMMEISAPQETLDAVRESAEKHGAPFALEVTETSGGSFQIRGKHITSDAHDALLAAFSTDLGEISESRFTTIGATVGTTLKNKALVAISLAIVVIVLFIAFAFRKIPRRLSPWKFGFAALVALLHDVVITSGVFAVFGIEIDALFITALLTVLGFSVHDTIVVFDRIRENLKYQTRDESFADITEKSLWQTMARSINTSASTIIVLVALLFLGAGAIFNFVLALTIGILVGTYSSIFVASTILAKWQK